MSAPDLVETDDGSVIIGKVRCYLAIEAIQEIGELCNVLCIAIPQDSYPEHPIARGLSARIGDLAKAVYAALGDERDPTDEIARRVRITIPEMEGKA